MAGLRPKKMALTFQYHLRKSEAIYLYMFHIGHAYIHMHICIFYYEYYHTDLYKYADRELGTL